MPETEPEAVERLLAETAEARDLLRLHPNFTIGPAHDVRGLVDYAARGGVLDPAALLEVSDTVRSGRMTREMLVRRAESFPHLSLAGAGDHAVRSPAGRHRAGDWTGCRRAG